MITSMKCRKKSLFKAALNVSIHYKTFVMTSLKSPITFSLPRLLSACSSHPAWKVQVNDTKQTCRRAAFQIVAHAAANVVQVRFVKPRGLINVRISKHLSFQENSNNHIRHRSTYLFRMKKNGVFNLYKYDYDSKLIYNYSWWYCTSIFKAKMQTLTAQTGTVIKAPVYKYELLIYSI